MNALETLRKLVKEVEPHGPVVMTGLITMPEKLEAYSASDVVVYPGAYEIFGLVPSVGGPLSNAIVNLRYHSRRHLRSE